MDSRQLPPTTVARLPLYLRCLLEAQTRGDRVISSETLAQMCGTRAPQVRKDLSFLGELGVRGVGYDVDALAAHLARRLGVDTQRRVAIVGFGRLGEALRSYPGFARRGFEVVAVLDDDPEKIGRPSGNLTVKDARGLERVLREEDVEVVLISTPPSAAQHVADRTAAAGVKAILNMAPLALEAPAGVTIRNADLAAELQILSFHLGLEASDTEGEG